MKFKRIKTIHRRWTFENTDILDWVKIHSKGRILNLFAGNTSLYLNEIRVDINKQIPADYHMDVLEFVNTYQGEKFDTVIIDPNVKHRYSDLMLKLKDNLYKVLNPNATVINISTNSSGMGKERGFEIIEICLFNYTKPLSDSIGVVEKWL